MTNQSWRWLYLNVPLGAAATITLALHFCWPADGLWANLSTTFVGSIVAVNYIDRVIQRRAEFEWREATQLIGQRLRHLSFSAITSIRAALDLSAKQLSLDAMDIHDKSAYLRVCERDIEPAVDGLVRRLDQKGWSKLANALQLTHRDCHEFLIVFGSKVRPSEFRELLALQDNVHGVLSSYATFPDLLGVADDKLPQIKHGDQIEYKHALTRQLAAQTSSIVVGARKIGALAIELELGAPK